MTLYVRTDATFTIDGLPQVNTEYVPAIEGAEMDFTTAGMPLGDVPVWNSFISDHKIPAYGGFPQAVDFNGTRAVETDGSSTAFQFEYTRTLHTSVAVHRYVVANDHNTVHRGIANDEGYFYIPGGGGNQGGLVGKSGTMMNPPVAPDTGWHVLVTVNNGYESFVNLDGVHQGIRGDSYPRAGYMLGGSVAAPYRGASMYQRFAIIPEIISPDRAAAIVGLLMDHYGI